MWYVLLWWFVFICLPLHLGLLTFQDLFFLCFPELCSTREAHMVHGVGHAHGKMLGPENHKPAGSLCCHLVPSVLPPPAFLGPWIVFLGCSSHQSYLVCCGWPKDLFSVIVDHFGKHFSDGPTINQLTTSVNPMTKTLSWSLLYRRVIYPYHWEDVKWPRIKWLITSYYIFPVPGVTIEGKP